MGVNFFDLTRLYEVDLSLRPDFFSKKLPYSEKKSGNLIKNVEGYRVPYEHPRERVIYDSLGHIRIPRGKGFVGKKRLVKAYRSKNIILCRHRKM